jgi:hypothetical protein
MRTAMLPANENIEAQVIEYHMSMFMSSRPTTDETKTAA